jgi:hypothetical protein
MEKVIQHKDKFLFAFVILMDIIAFGVPSFNNPLKSFAPGSFIFFIGVIVFSFYHLIYKKRQL